MALGDVKLLADAAFGAVGSRTHKVASGAVATINAGELVLKTLGSAFVVAWGNTNAKPVVGTDFIAGVSTSTSTDTATADGTVDIMPIDPKMVFLISPNVAATFATQAAYDALVGDRVLLASGSTGGAQTILATDGATSGLVIQPLNIQNVPGKVAFSIRAGAFYMA